MAAKPEKKIFQLKITLAQTDPPIWRRVLAEPSTTLGELHSIIQSIMPWQDYHLHQFKIGNKFYGDPETDDYGSKTHNEYAIDLRALQLKRIRKFSYEYDFGDSWDHVIEIETLVPKQSDILYPCCVEGEGACPPEDSGGPFGFSQKLEVMNDPGHPDYADIKEWMGDFSPSEFSLKSANQRLEDLFYEEVVDDIGALEIFRTSCGWCLAAIDENEEVYGQEVKLAPDFDWKSHQGEVVPIEVAGADHPLLCLIPTEDSPAHQKGSTGFFQLCSAECAHQLRGALNKRPLEKGQQESTSFSN